MIANPVLTATNGGHFSSSTPTIVLEVSAYTSPYASSTNLNNDNNASIYTQFIRGNNRLKQYQPGRSSFGMAILTKTDNLCVAAFPADGYRKSITINLTEYTNGVKTVKATRSYEVSATSQFKYVARDPGWYVVTYWHQHDATYGEPYPATGTCNYDAPPPWSGTDYFMFARTGAQILVDMGLADSFNSFK